MFKSVYALICLWLLVSASCQNGNKLATENQQSASSEVPAEVEILKPYNGSKIKLGQPLDIQLKMLHPAQNADSLTFFINGLEKTLSKTDSVHYGFNTSDIQVGTLTIEVKACVHGTLTKSSMVSVMVLSDIRPKMYTYNVVKTFPHSRNAYTQGLIYRDGYFFESDGQYGKSALRKVNATTGETVNLASLEQNIFAEGIAINNNKIYQISWKERICFVYNIESLKLERRFTYDIAEGWGLESTGANLLMTDGSNTIYTVDPEYFNVLSKVDVMDNNGPVEQLNELELIDNKLYANIYTTDTVAIIDYKSGKVLGKIDFTGLLPPADRDQNTDVLNGIALNSTNSHLYITGKNWPKLFEVSIKEKK